MPISLFHSENLIHVLYKHEIKVDLKTGLSQSVHNALELSNQLHESREQTSGLDQLVEEIVGNTGQIFQQFLDQLLDDLQEVDNDRSQGFDQFLDGSQKVVNWQVQSLGNLSDKITEIASQARSDVLNLKT